MPEVLRHPPESVPETGRRGHFIAVVGPSGAGKDSLISQAAFRLEGDSQIRFARRVITRPADQNSEDHDSLSEIDFRRAEAEGAFCLTWQAHGLLYGIPAQVGKDLSSGLSVVANLSRQSLPQAVERFGPIQVVEVTVRPELLLERIAARGRESRAEIAARLQRRVPLELPDPSCGLLRIDNSGALQAAVDRFVDHLVSLARSG